MGAASLRRCTIANASQLPLPTLYQVQCLCLSFILVSSNYFRWLFGTFSACLRGFVSWKSAELLFFFKFLFLLFPGLLQFDLDTVAIQLLIKGRGHSDVTLTYRHIYSRKHHFSALTLLVGRQEGHPACKTLGVGLLVLKMWLELYTSYSSSYSSPPPSSSAPIKSRVETFWYRLTQIHLENGR